jgi:uroporphyrinogen-III synthase
MTRATPSSAPLAGRRVAVTRPEGQAAGLAQGIRAAGGEPLLIPAIEIRELEDLRPFQAIADRLGSFDVAIFVSRNAVRKALAMLRARRGGRPWPARLAVATVGQGSREALEAEGFSGVIAPNAQSDSEALLALPELGAVNGKRVVIFRGDGGRRLLGDVLAKRGAVVEFAACYRRVRPEAGLPPAFWPRGVDAVTLSSAEGLENFLYMLGEGGAQRLAQTPFFVPHRRIAEEAARRGLARVLVAGPRDAEMVAALVAYFDGAS